MPSIWGMNAGGEETAALLRRCSHGDEGACGELFGLVYADLHRRARRWVGGADASAVSWIVGDGAAERAVCGRVGTVMSADEWRTYVPDTPYAPPCR